MIQDQKKDHKRSAPLRRAALTASAAACTLLSATPALALDQIVRPFYGIRAAGMGGTFTV